MAGEHRRRVRSDDRNQPIPLDPIDLLAGLAPGVVLEADPLPGGVAEAEDASEATATANDIGRLLRQVEPTVRRLIRTPGIEPATDGAPDDEPQRSPFAPGTPDKPGE